MPGRTVAPACGSASPPPRGTGRKLRVEDGLGEAETDWLGEPVAVAVGDAVGVGAIVGDAVAVGMSAAGVRTASPSTSTYNEDRVFGPYPGAVAVTSTWIWWPLSAAAIVYLAAVAQSIGRPSRFQW